MVHGLRHLSYEQRLRHLELTSLKERRIRGDLLQLLKLWLEKKGWPKSVFPALYTCEYQLRRHTMKLSKQRTSLDVRKYSFSQRVVQEWNKLPQESRCCGSYVCEPVLEQIGQLLAKIWTLKAWLYQHIIWQVTSIVRCERTCSQRRPTPLLFKSTKNH